MEGAHRKEARPASWPPHALRIHQAASAATANPHPFRAGGALCGAVAPVVRPARPRRCLPRLRPRSLATSAPCPGAHLPGCRNQWSMRLPKTDINTRPYGPLKGIEMDSPLGHGPNRGRRSSLGSSCMKERRQKQNYAESTCRGHVERRVNPARTYPKAAAIPTTPESRGLPKT